MQQKHILRPTLGSAFPPPSLENSAQHTQWEFLVLSLENKTDVNTRRQERGRLRGISRPLKDFSSCAEFCSTKASLVGMTFLLGLRQAHILPFHTPCTKRPSFCLPRTHVWIIWDLPSSHFLLSSLSNESLLTLFRRITCSCQWSPGNYM